MDLDTHKIRWVIYSPASAMVGADPVVANYRQHHVAFFKLVIDEVSEINANRNAINIHEDGIFTKLASKPIMYSASHWS